MDRTFTTDFRHWFFGRKDEQLVPFVKNAVCRSFRSVMALGLFSGFSGVVVDAYETTWGRNLVKSASEFCDPSSRETPPGLWCISGALWCIWKNDRFGISK